MTWWQWVGVAVWLFFGVVAVTMIPPRQRLPMLARFALFIFHLLIFVPFGLFAFAMALDSVDE